MKMLTILCRKCTDIHALKQDTKTLITQLKATPEILNISRIIPLKHMEFYDFKENLLEEREWLKDTGGEILLVKEIGTNDQSGIIVQSSGFDYARYAGLPIEEEETHKCPRCGKYYLGHPAISRKDNKTEICSTCGTEEALLQAGFDIRILDLLDKMQETADQYKVKITVEKPAQGKKKAEKIVIKPQKK